MISQAARSQTKSRSEANLNLIRTLRAEQDEAKYRELRNRVVVLNLGLVRNISRKYSNSRQDENEFFSEGCLALIDAVELFDPERGFQFSTYATACIRNRLFRLFRERERRPHEVPLDQTHLELEPAPPRSNHHQLDDSRRLAERLLLDIPARERELLRLRFGLDTTGRPRSFREVAYVVGLSKERVRQLVNHSIQLLQSRPITVPKSQSIETVSDS